MPPPVASNGQVRVCREMCATCVFRPGNLMQLQPGRLRSMIDEAKRGESGIVCHSTLDLQEAAICRGFFDRHADEVWTLRLATRLGWVVDFDLPAP